jgi:hypothetical protein
MRKYIYLNKLCKSCRSKAEKTSPLTEREFIELKNCRCLQIRQRYEASKLLKGGKNSKNDDTDKKRMV